MPVDELFEESERLKLRFLAAMERMVKRGLLTEEQFAEVIDLVDRLDEYSEEEIEARLGKYISIIKTKHEAGVQKPERSG
ncbi:MAG TPA: hypothetical protein GXX29_13410 [Firmicutes bacterium]|nr:hypothetical protein [Bacillota bacterium]